MYLQSSKFCWIIFMQSDLPEQRSGRNSIHQLHNAAESVVGIRKNFAILA